MPFLDQGAPMENGALCIFSDVFFGCADPVDGYAFKRRPVCPPGVARERAAARAFFFQLGLPVIHLARPPEMLRRGKCPEFLRPHPRCKSLVEVLITHHPCLFYPFLLYAV
jgi:hypothetical protein